MSRNKRKNPVNPKRNLFWECCNGFGFEEIDQEPDGVYCTGCLVVHKRPTKMYTNGQKEILCRHAVIRLYNPDD
jgi:hypothetical protein